MKCIERVFHAAKTVNPNREAVRARITGELE